MSTLLPLATQVSIPYGSVTPDNGETWYITFWQTRTPTDEGMVVDGSGYAKAFVVDDPAVTVRPHTHTHTH